MFSWCSESLPRCLLSSEFFVPGHECYWLFAWHNPKCLLPKRKRINWNGIWWWQSWRAVCYEWWEFMPVGFRRLFCFFWSNLFFFRLLHYQQSSFLPGCIKKPTLPIILIYTVRQTRRYLAITHIGIIIVAREYQRNLIIVFGLITFWS